MGRKQSSKVRVTVVLGRLDVVKNLGHPSGNGWTLVLLGGGLLVATGPPKGMQGRVRRVVVEVIIDGGLVTR